MAAHLIYEIIYGTDYAPWISRLHFIFVNRFYVRPRSTHLLRMPPYFTYANYLMPLAIADLSSGQLVRYAGVSFFLRDDGLLATCKHIIESCAAHETLFAMDLATGGFLPLANIKVHQRYDFAIAEIHLGRPHSYFPFHSGEVALGTDVQALGFINGGRKEKDVIIEPRLFKGYIARSSPTPSTAARSTLELSFPSLKGFSGAPVTCAPNDELIGMLFSNHESTIELFQHSEVAENQQTFRESIHRIVESGLAHSATDIRTFLADLGVSLEQA